MPSHAGTRPLPRAPGHELSRRGWGALLLIVAVTILYWRVGDYPFTQLDDHNYIVDNPVVRAGLTAAGMRWALTATHASNWHPVTWLSHMADITVFGLHPGPPHLVNVAIHALNAILLFLLLARMTGAPLRSLTVAALFAVHPAHVESVAWVAERKDVLSTLFLLLTILAYVRYRERPTWRRYSVVFVVFAVGLMTKPMLVSAPLVLILIDYWPLMRGSRAGRAQSWKPLFLGFIRLLRDKVPLIALATAASVVTYCVQKAGGAVDTGDVLRMPARVGNALVAYVAYIDMALWPRSLSVLYPHPEQQLPLFTVIVAFCLLAGMSTMAIRLRVRRPYLAVGWFWFLITLVPVIGFVQVGVQAMADRYTYVPYVGLFVIAAWGGEDLARCRTIPGLALSAGTAAILAVLAAVSWMQVGYWRSNVVLFRRALSVTEGNWFMHNALGTALEQQGLVDEAIVHYREALRISPDYATGHYNLGVALDQVGRREEAVDHYREAIRIKPGHVEARDNLGVDLAKLGRYAEAIDHFREALRLRPDSPITHYNLGVALDQVGGGEQAIAHYRAAVRLAPDYAEAHDNLGVSLARAGRLAEAIEHFRETVRLKPDMPEAHNNLGVALRQAGLLEEATYHFREALRLDPGYVQARQNIEEVLERAGVPR